MRDCPVGWDRFAALLAARRWRRIAVLGARDSGKSTFCAFLLDRLTDGGEAAGLLDTDLGQKMIGPPACVTLGVRPPGEALALSRLRFVGDHSPVFDITGVVAGAARLAQGAPVARLVVNTCGFVEGPGLSLKRWTLDALAPDCVVALAEGDELAPVLAPLPPGRVYRLAPSPQARPKPPGLRVAGRALRWAEALAGAVGRRLDALVVEDLRRLSTPPGAIRLCALGDRDGEDLGVGLARVAEAGAAPWVLTAVDSERAHRLRLGEVAAADLLASLPEVRPDAQDAAP